HLQMVPGQRIRAKLDIRRRDAADLDQLSLALDYRAGGATLALSSSLAGKAGGLLAAIFGARPEEDIAIEVAGSGPLARWRGTLSGHVGSAARASARIESTGDRVEMAGRIELDEARLPAPLGAILGSGGEFRLGAGAARDGRIALSARADLDRGTYHLDGNIAPEGATRLDLALSANLAEATPLTHALAMPDAFAAATITGHLRGTLLEPAFAGRLTIRQPRGAQGLRAAELDNVLSLRLAPETLAFRITGQAMDLVLQQRPMGTFDYAASGTIARADGQIGVSEFRIAGPPVSATGNATVRPRDGGWRLKATIEVPDPAALLPDLRLGGRLAGTIELVQEGARAPLSGTAAFRATGFQSGDGAIDRLLARAPRLGVRFVRVPGGALRLSALHLAGSHATLDAAGDIDPAGATLSMRYRLAIHDIGTLAGPGRLALEGAATIEGRLEGPLAAPKVDFEARLPRLDLARIVLRDLDLAGVLTDPFGTPAARIRLTAASDAGPVVAETLAKTTGPGALAFEDVRLDIGGVRLAGQLLRDAKGLLRGRLSSPSVMPERLVAGLGEGLEGALGVAIDLAAPAGVQEIRATVDGSGLRLRAGPDAALAIGSLSLAARARFGPERPAIEARLEIAALEAGLARIDAIGITAHAGKAPLRLEARARGQWRGELALDAALALDDAATHMSARLDLAGTLFGSPLAVGEPLRLETAPGEWRIEAPDIRLGAGRIALTATHEAGTRRLRFTLAGLPLALLNRFSERPLPRGTVDAALDLRQQGGDSRGTIHLAIRGMRPWSEPLRPLPPVDLVIAAEIAGGLLSLDARTTAADALSGAARVALPVAIDLARARLSLDRAAPLRGHVSWRGALAPAFALSGMPALAAGRLDIDADLAGTLMAPRLEGRLRLDDGRFEHVASGFVASDIRLAALLAGRHLEVTELSAGDGNGGTIAGTGSLAWSPAGGLDADIALRLAHARILRRPGLAAQVSGDLRVTSDPDGVRLSGQVAAERVDLDLKQRSSDEIVTIAVTEINGGPTTTARAGGTAQRPRPLLLDLALDAPRHLFVRGRGIDSEWSARLTASGPADRPRIGGTASLVRGSFDFLGRRFDFD
ncbi:MAG: translocation/assembly module TamB domain-containing protein, partial [Rhodothalassiaceae bacterium]